MDEKIPKEQWSGVLHIGNMDIECAVLDDGTRVLSYRGMSRAMNLSDKWTTNGASELPPFLRHKALKPYIPSDISAPNFSPIIYQPKHGGRTAFGVKADLMPKILDAWLDAQEAGALNKPKDLAVAVRAKILMRGLAHVGIIALVDEATGYQEIRDKVALQSILDKFITDEWAKWTKTFPDEYYKQLFRLKGIDYRSIGGRKPSYIGSWTNDIVYKRLAPAVLTALKEKNPKNERGNRSHKFHQSLTTDYGHPKLKEHLNNVIFLMKGCAKWSDFERILNRTSPRYGDTLTLDLPDTQSVK